MYSRGENIIPVYIEDEMKDSYISYAMSVIVGRALPDIRDGLKPVHRRILYAMKELRLDYNKPYKKCARITGEVLGKFHPHGDMAVYDALVRMSQDFSLRYPLIDGQGNFGSVDGDAPAAMRYTEARLAYISEEMLNDLDKDTVDFSPNFDGSLKEPVVLPASLPNLIINGSSGIAVGMATNIPPHNLGEVIDAICLVIDRSDVDIEELLKVVKGPDFPTGGIICGAEGIKEAYTNGRGILKLNARAYIETQKGERDNIVITEIPYQVNKSNLIEQIAQLVQTKKIEGIGDLRDESDREGMRIVIELKRDVNAQIILNRLYKHTQMSTSFGIILLALVDNRPRILNLKQILSLYVEHRKNIIRRRTKFLLDKAENRAHILEGLKIALSNLDKVISIIKKSKSVSIAKEALIENFKLTNVQAQAILEMQLQRLTGLEREKIDVEYLELIKNINIYKGILSSEKKILEIIGEELKNIKEKFSDDRRTEILPEEEKFEIEDLIAEENVVITVSHSEYIKRLPVSSYRRQQRGGVGVTGVVMREQDFVEHIFIASTYDYILFFTDSGKVHWLKVHEIPQAGRTTKGSAIINLIGISKEEAITSFIPIRNFDERFMVMATKQGKIKKTSLASFGNPRKGGIAAIGLSKNDKLIRCCLTEGERDIMLATRNGKIIRFNEGQIRMMGRNAAGVKGITLGKNDEVISMVKITSTDSILSITTKGYGKRTKISKYKVQSRAGKGVINMKLTKKNGKICALNPVTEKDEILIITQEGMIVRCSTGDIRLCGRNTEGVKVVRLKEKDEVVGVAKVPKES